MSPAAATRRLLDVLEAENSALLRLDLPGAAALLAAKQQALETFNLAWSSRGAIPQAESGLRDLPHLLQAAATENRRLLERAMTVQRRILALLAQAAQEQVSEGRYGAHGRYSGSRSETPFALNARA